MFSKFLKKIKTNNVLKKVTYVLSMFAFGLTIYLLMLPALATTSSSDIDVANQDNTFTVHQTNNFSITNGSGNTLVYGSSANKKIYDLLKPATTNTFRTWTTIIIEYINGEYVVRDKLTSVTEEENLNDYVINKRNVVVPENGFVFMVWDKNPDFNRATEVAIGSKVTFNLENEFNKSISNKNGVGTISFSQPTPKSSKDYNFEKITTVDTKDLIEINLYDYGTNINEKHLKEDKYYPAFIQSGGSKYIYDLDSTKSFGFGDMISVDGDNIYNPSASTLVGINLRNPDNPNNRPLSGEMHPTLKNDYPALKNGKSLEYLFSNNKYATKLNTENVNYLFQQNETTGAYFYNSRETHAQFNASTNSFTIYNHLITPNFTIYPFGNFLPFNNIETQTTKTSEINTENFKEVAASAMYKYLNTSKEYYKNTANKLSEFDYLLTQKFGKDWDAGEAATSYFKAAGLNATIETSKLSNLYNLDFDEPTNFHFGLNMKMEFMQPKNGKTGVSGNENMVFYFNGDDDVWVYIDGVLFLDLSGMHRHVGGEIDFVNGKVNYYDLDVSIGDVTAKPVKTVTFEQILGSKTGLNSKGTFENYSTHSFDFYYMERGSGSSVMKMEFNMPLLQKNSLSISKNVETENNIDVLGNQEYLFQILDSNDTTQSINDPLFVKNSTYNLYDDFGNKLNEEPIIISGDGIIKIKDGEHAVISGIDENKGTYYVRELLSEEYYNQYKKVIVNDKEISKDKISKVEISGKSYYVINSEVNDITNDDAIFVYKNIIDNDNLGKLKIKKLLGENTTDTNKKFEILVKIDDELLPVGTKYKIGANTYEVENAGIIKIRRNEEAIIENILAGSSFNVKEKNPFTSGYEVNYTADDLIVNNEGVSGTMEIQGTFSIVVTNTERSNEIEIPVTKVLNDTDNLKHTYKFNLYKVDGTAETLIDTISIKIDETGSKEEKFIIKYLQPEHTSEKTIYKYRIKEVIDTNDLYTKYDNSIYDIEVTVLNKENGVFSASITGILKDDSKVSDIKFTNTLLSSVTIKKVVESKNPNSEGKFKFEIKSSNLKNKEFKTLIDSNNSTISFDEDGVGQIELGHNETITIFGLNKGTKLEIKEKNSQGFAVMYKVNSNSYNEGNTVTNLILDNYENNIEFKNMKGYVLPETGNSTELILVIIGTLLVSCPIIYIGYTFYSKKRNSLNF